jgi:hypothetical protein
MAECDVFDLVCGAVPKGDRQTIELLTDELKLDRAIAQQAIDSFITHHGDVEKSLRKELARQVLSCCHS